MEFDELSEKQKADALACKTPEEILELAKEEDYDLSDEELQGVAGGWGEAECPDKAPPPCPNYIVPRVC